MQTSADNRTRRRGWRWFALGTAALAGLAALTAWFAGAGSREPVHEGRTLRQWMRGHPRDYTPAVRAMGTNAIPFLLLELTRPDPAWSRWGEECFRRFLDSLPPWEVARQRKYHARLALQILDTNAVPALLDAALQGPDFRLQEENAAWQAAFALTWMASAEAQAQVLSALNEALASADPEQRRRGCLVLGLGVRAGEPELRRLLELTRDADARVRAAATRALITCRMDPRDVLPGLVARLDDEHPAVRSLAIQGLRGRGTNAVEAVPALLAAYTNEIRKARLSTDVDDLFRGERALSAYELRWAIRGAIQEIDPARTPAWEGR